MRYPQQRKADICTQIGREQSRYDKSPEWSFPGSFFFGLPLIHNGLKEQRVPRQRLTKAIGQPVAFGMVTLMLREVGEIEAYFDWSVRQICAGFFFRSVQEGSSVLDDIGGAEGDRTPDLKTASLARSQLRHSPKRSENLIVYSTCPFYLEKKLLASVAHSQFVCFCNTTAPPLSDHSTEYHVKITFLKMFRIIR